MASITRSTAVAMPVPSPTLARTRAAAVRIKVCRRTGSAAGVVLSALGPAFGVHDFGEPYPVTCCGSMIGSDCTVHFRAGVLLVRALDGLPEWRGLTRVADEDGIARSFPILESAAGAEGAETGGGPGGMAPARRPPICGVFAS
jgi:hypothetical protein